MTGTKANGDFSTAGSAEWPTGMCRNFSQGAVEDWGLRLQAFAGLLREGRAPSQLKKSAKQPREGVRKMLMQRPSLCGNATVDGDEPKEAHVFRPGGDWSLTAFGTYNKTLPA